MSKKILGIVSAILVAGAIHAATVTNYLKQVVTVDANGVVTSVVVDQGAATNLPRSEISALGFQVSTSIDATTTKATITPREIGDLLLFPNATNNLTLFVAYGMASTNWARITTTK